MNIFTTCKTCLSSHLDTTKNLIKDSNKKFASEKGDYHLFTRLRLTLGNNIVFLTLQGSTLQPRWLHPKRSITSDKSNKKKVFAPKMFPCWWLQKNDGPWDIARWCLNGWSYITARHSPEKLTRDLQIIAQVYLSFLWNCGGLQWLSTRIWCTRNEVFRKSYTRRSSRQWKYLQVEKWKLNFPYLHTWLLNNCLRLTYSKLVAYQINGYGFCRRRITLLENVFIDIKKKIQWRTEYL